MTTDLDEVATASPAPPLDVVGISTDPSTEVPDPVVGSPEQLQQAVRQIGWKPSRDSAATAPPVLRLPRRWEVGLGAAARLGSPCRGVAAPPSACRDVCNGAHPNVERGMEKEKRWRGRGAHGLSHWGATALLE